MVTGLEMNPEDHFEKDFKDATLSELSGWLPNGTIPPKSPSEDLGERTVKGHLEGDIITCMSEFDTVRAANENEINSSAVSESILDVVATQYSNEFERLEMDFVATQKNYVRQIEDVNSDIALEKARLGLAREPIEDTLKNVMLLIVPFAILEILLTYYGLSAQQVPLMQSAALSLSVSAINIGLGGFVNGFVLWPKIMSKDKSLGRWLSTVTLVINNASLLGVNGLVGHSRSDSDFLNSVDLLVSNPLGYNNISGLFVTIGGILVALFWGYKFGAARDVHVLYGALGSKRTTLRSELKECEAHYRSQLEMASGEGCLEVQKVVNEALKKAVSARNSMEALTDAKTQFSAQQDMLLSHYATVATVRRRFIQNTLQAKAPSYLRQAVDLAKWKRSLPDINGTQKKVDSIVDAAGNMGVACAGYMSGIQKMRADFQRKMITS